MRPFDVMLAWSTGDEDEHSRKKQQSLEGLDAWEETHLAHLCGVAGGAPEHTLGGAGGAQGGHTWRSKRGVWSTSLEGQKGHWEHTLGGEWAQAAQTWMGRRGAGSTHVEGAGGAQGGSV